MREVSVGVFLQGGNLWDSRLAGTTFWIPATCQPVKGVSLIVTFQRIFIDSKGSSTPPRYSSGVSTPQSYSPGSSRNVECSNCKHLLDKITVLEEIVEMYMHPEQHTVNSAALLHKVYNDMGKLNLE
ncbi:hypothetical protein Tco_0898913 [Tanacetum coccineum]